MAILKANNIFILATLFYFRYFVVIKYFHDYLPSFIIASKLICIHLCTFVYTNIYYSSCSTNDFTAICKHGFLSITTQLISSFFNLQIRSFFVEYLFCGVRFPAGKRLPKYFFRCNNKGKQKQKPLHERYKH